MKPQDYIISIQNEIEKAPTHQNFPVGRLLYHYARYQTTGESRHGEQCKEILAKVIASIVVEDITDNQILREFLLTNIYQQKIITKSLSRELGTLNEYLIDSASALIKSNTFTGWYSAGVISNFFSKKVDQVSEKVYLQHLISLWDKAERLLMRDNLFDQLLVFEDNVPLGLEGIAGFILMMIATEKTNDSRILKRVIQQGIRFIFFLKKDVDFSRQIYSIFPSSLDSQKKPNIFRLLSME